MGRLTVISDHLEGSFDLPGRPWKIGRGNDCDIQLVHKSVSRHHCIVTEADGQLRVEDLGSTYGTYINGAQVADAHAGNGDKVKLGRIVMVYEAQADAVPISAPAPAAAKTPTAPPPAAPSPPPSAPVKPRFVSNPAPQQSPRPAPQPTPNLPPAGPVARFKDSPPVDEDAGGDRPPRKPATGGVYNRLHGGHQRKPKAERPDYEKESEAWEEKAEAMSEDGGPDYAAEAEDWERVWGKAKKRRGGFFFGGGSSGGGLMGVFGALPAKLRAVVLLAILAGIGMGGKYGYDQATAHILVPNNVAKKKTLRPTPDNKDAILEKAVETFGKTIPQELREDK